MRWKIATVIVALVALGLGGALYRRDQRAKVDAAAAEARLRAQVATNAKLTIDKAACEKARAELDAQAQERVAKLADAMKCTVVPTKPWGANAIAFKLEGQAAEFWHAFKRDENVQVLNLIVHNDKGFLIAGGTKCSFVTRRGDVAQVRFVDGPEVGKLGWVPNDWRLGN